MISCLYIKVENRLYYNTFFAMIIELIVTSLIERIDILIFRRFYQKSQIRAHVCSLQNHQILVNAHPPHNEDARAAALVCVVSAGPFTLTLLDTS